MNCLFMYILLNIWLSNDLFSWSLNSLYSILCIIFCWFNNRILINCLIFSSVNFNLNVFSLDHRLDICLIIYFFTWSINIHGSTSILNLRFSCDWLSVDCLSLRRYKINFFIIINNCSFNYWLG